MADQLDAVLDHVAIAVPDWDGAERRWVNELGAGRVAWEHHTTFSSRQLRFTGGGKLELLSPPRGDAGDGGNFVRRFLDRFGSAVHHVTLKVGELGPAIELLRGAGLDVVHVRDDGDVWHEGFLRPSQVGGVVVQVAWSGHSDEEWAASHDHVPEPPRADTATLRGPTLRHPDLAAARHLWTLLGADVRADADRLRCVWPDSPLDIVITPGEPAGPTDLRMRGAGWHGAAAGVGPAIADESPSRRRGEDSS